MYYSANEYYIKTFGRKVYKIALSTGLSCPNRDGKIATGGCIFCSKGGSGEFATGCANTIDVQIEQAIDLVKNKIKTNSYIAYFQSFSNTYGSIEYLTEIFTDAINNPQIVGLSIATRPDCFSEEIYSLLKRLNKIKPVFIELGLQTTKESSAKYIRRGYELPVFDECVDRLKKDGINVIVHIILGLPKETMADMAASVSYVCNKGIDGIKLQLLHVLKGTDLARDYLAGSFKALTLDEYIDILCNIIEIIPPKVVIHRLTGDGAKSLLIAPLWSANKKMVINSINKEFRQRNIIQGSKAKTDL